MHGVKVLLQIFLPPALAATAAATADSGNQYMKAVVGLPFKLSDADQLQYELGSEDLTAFAEPSWARRSIGRFSAASFFAIVIAALAVTFLILQCFKMLQASSSKLSEVRGLATGGPSCSDDDDGEEEEEEERLLERGRGLLERLLERLRGGLRGNEENERELLLGRGRGHGLLERLRGLRGRGRLQLLERLRELRELRGRGRGGLRGFLREVGITASALAAAGTILTVTGVGILGTAHNTTLLNPTEITGITTLLIGLGLITLAILSQRDHDDDEENEQNNEQRNEERNEQRNEERNEQELQRVDVVELQRVDVVNEELQRVDVVNEQRQEDDDKDDDDDTDQEDHDLVR